MTTARRVAFDLLEAVALEDAYANLALPSMMTEARLDGRDAAFCTELTMGTLRWRNYLDEVIENGSQRDIERIDPPLRDVLRLGAYQILFMRVPSHAAVNTTVELAHQVGYSSARGFVNATLRRVSEKSRAEWDQVITEDHTEELNRLSVLFSHPRWQVTALRGALGDKRDTLEELLRVDNEAPAVTGVSRSGERGVEALATHGTPGQWSDLAVKLTQDPHAIAEMKTGTVAVQDEGSQIIALIAAGVPLQGSDEHWLDLCSGPGGKAALMASLSHAHVTAVEPQAHRADLVRNSLSPVSTHWTVVETEGQDRRFATGNYDRVLVDAPCSGLGVIRRRAEARWRRTPADVAVLTDIQLELLQNALAAVRPGGWVLYSTCSPHVAETELVVEAALKTVPGSRLVDLKTVLGNVPHLINVEELIASQGSSPYLRLWPHIHNTDGMFAALLTRD